MTSSEPPYLPGSASTTAQPVPLGRFLPPYQPGTAPQWLRENLSGGQWLLDPLGAHPAIALEAARAGFRVLVTGNNPILAWMFETLAAAPQPAELQSALAELGATRRGEERLEVHIQSLYATACPGCGQQIQALAFLWHRGDVQPFARLLHCPHCGADGEFPVTPEDLAALTRLGSDSLHRSRALERVLSSSDPERPAVEEALKSYLPRPLYVLFTLINKVEGLPTSPERKRLLTALLISLCDEASSLWPWPSARTRPRQLTIPPAFRENNLWLALENAARHWQQPGEPVPFTHWPQEPPPGGICLYPGRLRNLMPLPEHIRPTAALGILPRPNQAFWTLSALWAGWLWGREAVQPLRRLFERRRYDWRWHAAALHSALGALNSTTPAGFPFFAILNEATPGFLAAAISAAQAAGLELDGAAMRSEEQSAQLRWRSARGKPRRPGINLEALARQGIHDHLIRRGQPASYLELMAAALLRIAQKNGLPAQQPEVDDATLDALQVAFTAALQDTGFLTRYQGTPGNPESGQWYLTQPDGAFAPLLERVENEILRRLESTDLTLPALDAALCTAFPGLLAPPLAWTRACLESYAVQDVKNPNVWSLRPENRAVQRAAALGAARASLFTLAVALGFTTSESAPFITWQDAAGTIRERFALVNEAAASLQALLETSAGDATPVLVYPHQRATLLAETIEADARISDTLLEHWRFLRFESLGDLAASPTPTYQALEGLLASESFHRREATQMQMF